MKTYSSIEEHIASFSPQRQAILEEIRETIHHTCPKATETIKYGIPTFQLNGKSLVHFAGYEGHIGFYPSPNGMEEFKKELKPYATGQGTAQFSWDKPLPLELITKITKYRMNEMEKK